MAELPSQGLTHEVSQFVVLADMPYLRLSGNQQQKWLYATWRGDLTASQIKQGGEQVLRLIQNDGYTRLLNDNSLVTGIAEDAFDEPMDAATMPLFFKAGLHYLAWVLAAEPRARAFAEVRVAAATWPLILTFEEIDAATEWLEQAV